jgi:hypothetical protein
MADDQTEVVIREEPIGDEVVTAMNRIEAEDHELWQMIRCFVGPGGAVNVQYNVRLQRDVELEYINEPLDQQAVSDRIFNEIVYDICDIVAVLKHKLDAALVRSEPTK